MYYASLLRKKLEETNLATEEYAILSSKLNR